MYMISTYASAFGFDSPAMNRIYKYRTNIQRSNIQYKDLY